MRKLPNIDELLETFEDAPSPPPDWPAGEVAVNALGTVLLDALLDSQTRNMFEQKPRLIIVRTENASLAEIVGNAIERRFLDVAVKVATERLRSGGVHLRIGGAELGNLQKARTLALVSQNPDEILDEAALAASDLIVSVPSLTPALLRKAIRRVTLGAPRGVTPAMARLDVPVIVAAVRPGLTARECVSNLQRALDRLSAGKASSVPLLSDLPLTRNVRTWSDDLIIDLDAVKAGTLESDSLTYGVLGGPPGTGKSLIAESLARTAGWAFVSASVGGWFAVGDGALGGVSRKVRAFVDQVLANEPCIGFLDEIDALPNRATLDPKHREWWLPVITLFLTEIDRVRKSGKKVLLLGATNYYDRLDDALIRPGRLHRHISVLPPDTEDEVVALLRYFLRGELVDADLSTLAKLGRGATPAEVEGWFSLARATARGKNRPLALDDVLEQMVPKDDRSPKDIRAIALHEIGHALVAHRLGHIVGGITIVPNSLAGGQTSVRAPSLVMTWKSIEETVTIALGGRAADMFLGSGANAGAGTDLAAATQILVDAIERQGLGGTLACLPGDGMKSAELWQQVDAHLKRLLGRAKRIIETDRDAAIQLTERLMDEKVLSGQEIAEALSSTKAANQAGVDRSSRSETKEPGLRLQ